jgi:hypothetical protein
MQHLVVQGLNALDVCLFGSDSSAPEMETPKAGWLRETLHKILANMTIQVIGHPISVFAIWFNVCLMFRPDQQSRAEVRAG